MQSTILLWRNFKPHKNLVDFLNIISANPSITPRQLQKRLKGYQRYSSAMKMHQQLETHGYTLIELSDAGFMPLCKYTIANETELWVISYSKA